MSATATIQHFYFDGESYVPGKAYDLPASVGSKRINIYLESGSRWVKRYAYMVDPFNTTFRYKHPTWEGEHIKFTLKH